MKKNTSWKFTDELSVTFQSSVSGAGEFGLCLFYRERVYALNFEDGVGGNVFIIGSVALL